MASATKTTTNINGTTYDIETNEDEFTVHHRGALVFSGWRWSSGKVGNAVRHGIDFILANYLTACVEAIPMQPSSVMTAKEKAAIIVKVLNKRGVKYRHTERADGAQGFIIVKPESTLHVHIATDAEVTMHGGDKHLRIALEKALQKK